MHDPDVVILFASGKLVCTGLLTRRWFTMPPRSLWRS
ncbi:MAG: hypothetical protein FGF50_01630 [Candidatus Brockarchaeota archaeon]|nr:hypothetical protein [Candidatus Brockarchaeota archaeon]